MYQDSLVKLTNLSLPSAEQNRETEMSNLDKHYSVGFKAKVALEAIRGARTIPEIAIEFGVPASQITKWKKQVIDELPNILAESAEKENSSAPDWISHLYTEIGVLIRELDRVKRAGDVS